MRRCIQGPWGQASIFSILVRHLESACLLPSPVVVTDCNQPTELTFVFLTRLSIHVDLMDNHFTFDAGWHGCTFVYQLVSFGRLPGSLLRPRPASPHAISHASMHQQYLFFIFRLRKYDVSGSHHPQLQLSRPHFFFDEPLGLLPAATVVALWIAPPRPQRSTQACLSLSKCFSLPFLPWLGRRPFRPALEAQRHLSHHLVKQDTLPLLCQWPGLRRWSRPRRRRRKRQQNPRKRIKSRAAKDGR